MAFTSMTDKQGVTHSCTKLQSKHAEFLVCVSDATPEQLKALCWDYWAVTPGKEDFVFEEEGLEARSGLAGWAFLDAMCTHSFARVVGVACSVCHEPVMFGTRDEVLSFSQKAFQDDGGICEWCQQRRHGYVFHAAYDIDPVEAREIVLWQAVTLVGAIKFLGDETLTVLMPYHQCGTQEHRLSPSADYDYEILVALFISSLLKTDSRTPQERITFDDKNETFSVPIKDVMLTVPGPYDRAIQRIPSAYQYLENLLNKGQFGADDVAAVYQEIALHECLAYLELVMDDHGFEFTAGEKSTRIIQSGLQHFSVAQLYGLIWRAGRDTAAARARHPMTKENAVTAGVNSLERSIERAALNGWELNPFKRDRRLPESVISRVFSVAVIKQDDAVFNMTLAQIQQSRCSKEAETPSP